jgi:ABC-2 type transport system permease protein
MSKLIDHPLAQLTLMRMREFIREPEAVFWSMVFPIALAAGLGIAFRSRPPEILKVAAVTPMLAEAMRQEKLLDVMQLPPELAEQFVRTGKVALVAEPGQDHKVVYRYDDTNPEGRQARMLADQAIQKASGRQDAVTGNDQLMHDPGSRYIDFLIPGLIGMGIMGNSIWGTLF